MEKNKTKYTDLFSKIFLETKTPYHNVYHNLYKAVVRYISNLSIDQIILFGIPEIGPNQKIILYNITKHKRYCIKLFNVISQCIIISKNIYVLHSENEFHVVDNAKLKKIKLTNYPIDITITSLCAHNKAIYSICGKHYNTWLSDCFRYSIRTNKWKRLPNSKTAKDMTGCIVHKGYLFAIGGMYNYEPISKIEKLKLDNVSIGWICIEVQSFPDSGAICTGIPAIVDANNIAILGWSSNSTVLSLFDDKHSTITVISDNVYAKDAFSFGSDNNYIYWASRTNIIRLRRSDLLIDKIKVSQLFQPNNFSEKSLYL